MIRVGQKLKEARLQKNLTIDDVAKATKIKPLFLQAIEKGDYKKLPSSAYAYGFVRNYAEYIGFPKKEALALFRREFDEEKEFKVLPTGMSRAKEFPLKRLQIRETVFIAFFLLVLLSFYIAYQYRYALLSPPLSVLAPKEHATTSKDVLVAGKTDPNAVIVVNDEPVSVNTNGEFTKRLTLFPGKSTITIKARNRFNKETVVKRTVTVSS